MGQGCFEIFLLVGFVAFLLLQFSLDTAKQIIVQEKSRIKWSIVLLKVTRLPQRSFDQWAYSSSW